MWPVIALVLAGLAPAEPPPEPVVPEVEAPAAEPAPEIDPAVRAAQLFRDGEFVGAAAAFQRAYERSGDPALLYGRAQALRRAGNCGAAIDVFEQFIATAPPPADVDAAQAVIAACREILGEHDDALPPPVPVEPTRAPAPPPRRWHRDVTGGVLLGAGVVVATAGGALLGVAFANDGARSETEQAYEDRGRRVRTLGATGTALLVTGGALLVAAVARYAIVAQRTRRGGTTAWWPTARRLRF